MCDFSVVAKNQRDYRSGEQLVITQLGPHTRGTTSPGDRETAVCLLSGVCMAIPDLPGAIRRQYGLPPGTGEIRAIFMQLPNRDHAHRDALTFENGRTILINALPLDLCMTVQENRARVASAAVEPSFVRVR